jgi:hypothetical protein
MMARELLDSALIPIAKIEAGDDVSAPSGSRGVEKLGSRWPWKDRTVEELVVRIMRLF